LLGKRQRQRSGGIDPVTNAAGAVFLAFLTSWLYDPSRAIGASRPARILQFNNRINTRRIKR
jgi:hypothetical protein